MTEPLLTILTPTWNRRHLLPRLYESLVSQIDGIADLEWVIVDDGSTDGTETYLKELTAAAIFPVKVIRQENGGKHRALNYGMAQVTTPWLVIIDSDDWLLPGGLQRALESIRDCNHNPRVTAIISALEFGSRATKQYETNNETINFAKWCTNQPAGDSCIIMRSDTMRDYPFPDFDGEKFIAESSVWSRAFRDGGILLSNKRVVAAEYQINGLSDRSLVVRSQSPLGCLFTYQARLNAQLSSIHEIRSYLNYHRFYWHALHRGSAPKSHGFHAKFVWLIPAALLFICDRFYLVLSSS